MTYVLLTIIILVLVILALLILALSAQVNNVDYQIKLINEREKARGEKNG